MSEENTTAEKKVWQCGYELAELKEHARIFREVHKPLIYGAFGLVKERDIAAALAGNQFVSLREVNDTAAAITKRLLSTSTHRSFYGREIKLPAGDTFISAFAANSPGVGASLLRSITASVAPTSGTWLEIFEEDLTAKAVAAELGFKWVDTKISAGSEIKGLYTTRTVPANTDAAELATLTLLDESFLSAEQHAEIMQEISNYEGEWAQHYSTYNKRGTWTAFALRGYKPNDPTFIIRPDEMSKDWKEQNAALLAADCEPTVAAPHFPALLRAVDRIPGAKDRVRLMRLAAKGGELTRHADITLREAGVADGKLARLHVPLRTNPSVQFMQWDARGAGHLRHFAERSLFYLDQRKPHAVRNAGDAERIHLVVDAYSGAGLRAMLAGGLRGAAA